MDVMNIQVLYPHLYSWLASMSFISEKVLAWVDVTVMMEENEEFTKKVMIEKAVCDGVHGPFSPERKWCNLTFHCWHSDFLSSVCLCVCFRNPSWTPDLSWICVPIQKRMSAEMFIFSNIRRTRHSASWYHGTWTSISGACWFAPVVNLCPLCFSFQTPLSTVRNGHWVDQYQNSKW